MLPPPYKDPCNDSGLATSRWGLGSLKGKLPRLDHPVVSARTNTPASPRLASVSARECFRIAPVHSA